MELADPSRDGNGQVIRLLVVDDHGLVRDSVSAVLNNEADIQVVGTASDADEAIRKTLDLRPAVVLMDIDMPGGSCFDAIRIIRSRLPATLFVLFTAYAHDDYLDQALRAKANGFVLKHDGLPSLAEAVRRVAGGGFYCSAVLMKRLVVDGKQIRFASPLQTRLSVLSPRERELLRILAQGLSLKEAAALLGISYKTADKQKTSLMSKLDIHDRVALARFAIREGIIQA